MVRSKLVQNAKETWEYIFITLDILALRNSNLTQDIFLHTQMSSRGRRKTLTIKNTKFCFSSVSVLG